MFYYCTFILSDISKLLVFLLMRSQFFLVTILKMYFKSDIELYEYDLRAYSHFSVYSLKYFKFCLFLYCILKFGTYLVVHGHFIYYLEGFFSDETGKFNNTAFVSFESRSAKFFCALLKIILGHNNLFLYYFMYSSIRVFSVSTLDPK